VRPAHKADNLTVISEPIALKMWEPRLLTPLWALTACYRDNCTFTARGSSNCDINLEDLTLSTKILRRIRLCQILPKVIVLVLNIYLINRLLFVGPD
jgi:hypothetical protein